MLIIGERINSSRKPIASAIAAKDSGFLVGEARAQKDKGADFIDVNCAIMLDGERESLLWLMVEIQSAVDNVPISIDSPNPEIINEAIKIHKGKPFINSVTAETDKMRRMLGILNKKDVFLIALTVNDKGIPADTADRLKIARDMVNAMTAAGMDRDNIYVDPLVKPISSEPEQAKYFLETVKSLKKEKIKTIGGLSNVSYGLPAREILNTAFLFLAKEAGIDAAIIDPSVERRLSIVDLQSEAFGLAKKALLGDDVYCMNYIKAFRAGKLNG
ncbi:MAG: dihydropteroate synthase [Candidatus Omnitrophica bacterium]|nr:dihydropteroate synthase [Candidatus Omnitrophota bacterium]